MNVAFIPVRGGSKSIPLKNIKEMCGKPLVYWTINAAINCSFIDMVYVSTDSNQIKSAINSCGFDKSKLNVIDRSANTATDTASTESAMLEFANNYDFDNIVLIQATSPLLSTEDLNNGFNIFKQEDVDSVISVVEQKRFNWQIGNKGYVDSINYDYNNRPRRQDFNAYYTENGAFYITSKNLLLKSNNRISGNIKAAVMDEDTFFEIDEPSDWLIIENLLKKKISMSFNGSNIKLFLTDCDGCLTDAGMYYSEFGDELKKFNTRDGMAFSMLKNKGIKTGIITSEDVNLNKRRASKLKLDYLISGSKDKLQAIKDICKTENITLDNVLYIGDDINDIDALKSVGCSCCPHNAIDDVKSIVSYVSSKNGGEGAIRDIVNMIL